MITQITNGFFDGEIRSIISWCIHTACVNWISLLDVSGTPHILAPLEVPCWKTNSTFCISTAFYASIIFNMIRFTVLVDKHYLPRAYPAFLCYKRLRSVVFEEDKSLLTAYLPMFGVRFNLEILIATDIESVKVKNELWTRQISLTSGRSAWRKRSRKKKRNVARCHATPHQQMPAVLWNLSDRKRTKKGEASWLKKGPWTCSFFFWTTLTLLWRVDVSQTFVCVCDALMMRDIVGLWRTFCQTGSDFVRWSVLRSCPSPAPPMKSTWSSSSRSRDLSILAQLRSQRCNKQTVTDSYRPFSVNL